MTERHPLEVRLDLLRDVARNIIADYDRDPEHFAAAEALTVALAILGDLPPGPLPRPARWRNESLVPWLWRRLGDALRLWLDSKGVKT